MTRLVEHPRVKIPGYRIEEVRGVGAMATVYRAVQKRLQRPVAIKVLHEFVAQDADYRERFLREAKAAARLNHKNVVRAYEAGVHRGTYYFVMEYVEGEDLAERLGRMGSLAEDEALYVAIEVARALEAAEAHGMVHRDIKPENILLGDDGEVKLADLGLAKVQGDGSITAEGYSLGTVAFFSPEQCRGTRSLDIRSDLFALGGTLYTMITGELPFGRGDNPAVTMKKVLEEEPPDVEDPSKFSASVRHALRRLMAKDPADRPATASDAAQLLEEAMGRIGDSRVGVVETLQAHADQRPRRRRRRRHRLSGARARTTTGSSVAVLAGAAVGLGLLVGLLPALGGGEPRPPRPAASPEPVRTAPTRLVSDAPAVAATPAVTPSAPTPAIEASGAEAEDPRRPRLAAPGGAAILGQLRARASREGGTVRLAYDWSEPAQLEDWGAEAGLTARVAAGRLHLAAAPGAAGLLTLRLPLRPPVDLSVSTEAGAPWLTFGPTPGAGYACRGGEALFTLGAGAPRWLAGRREASPPAAADLRVLWEPARTRGWRDGRAQFLQQVAWPDGPLRLALRVEPGARLALGPLSISGTLPEEDER